jgi:adenylate cyclase
MGHVPAYRSKSRPMSEVSPHRDGAATQGHTTAPMDRWTLIFPDRELERAFLDDYFRTVRIPIRVAHLLGIAMWILWGLVVRWFLVDERTFDVVVRYAVLIPLLVAGLAVTYLPGWQRFFQVEIAVMVVLTGAVWIAYTGSLTEMPFDYGYVGVILIMTFSYSLVRMRLLWAVACSAILVALYVGFSVRHGVDPDRFALAMYYLASFLALGAIASYTMERSGRLLFLRERELDRERARSDALLRNILPQAIIDRLKARRQVATETRIADALDEVTVLFVDMEAFTEQAVRTPPDVLVKALDALFTRFDEIADRFGLEKIKTVGDAYMAVAGAPVPLPDHAAAAADMALALQEALVETRWPSGDPIRARVGIASGPAVAGVIGQRKFAYDLWGDTVNLASRLESHGEPGRILVAAATAARLSDRYTFGPVLTIDLKGRGGTPARFLFGRRNDVVGSAEAGSPQVDRGGP